MAIYCSGLPELGLNTATAAFALALVKGASRHGIDQANHGIKLSILILIIISPRAALAGVSVIGVVAFVAAMVLFYHLRHVSDHLNHKHTASQYLIIFHYLSFLLLIGIQLEQADARCD